MFSQLSSKMLSKFTCSWPANRRRSKSWRTRNDHVTTWNRGMLKLEWLFFKLTEEYLKLPPLQNAAVGVACVAIFSGDNAAYRAVISALDDGKATVNFVDYGNSDD